MWAGGAFEWNTSDADAALRVDEEATQSVSVGGVSVKSPTMMFVKQLREFRRSSAPEGSWAVREERNHVFQSNEQVLANQNKTKAPPQGE
jgi:hydroxyacyl-ACP dehydratase HTD2-like protein with hotdog domain